MAVFDFHKMEEKIQAFWEHQHIAEKTLELRKKSKRFVFFEGPPTANGRPGIHHFLSRAFKDLFNRYKVMRGFYVLRKAGWDTHGLPVELEIERELGFKNKKDIEEYGIAKFNAKARENVWTYKTEWEEFTRRMGFWLDLEHPYITYENDYIESVWRVLRAIWDRDLLYQAHKVVPFCTRCGTPLSSHEVAQGYKTVTDRSVYLKFHVAEGKGSVQKGDFILAWTTTPWTLPGNVALAVGNDIHYVIAQVGKERYVIAKDRAEAVLGDSFQTVAEISGKDLVGIVYEPLFHVEKLASDTAYRMYDADFVSTEEGTGVVHTAVMYGEDDYVLGTKLNLPKIHTVDEAGKFIGVNSDLNGLYVKDPKTEEKIIEYLRKHNLLLREEPYEHEYPFCWRCGTPLLYYAKTSWFIRMSAVRDQLIANNEKINWVPAHIKEGRFGQWLQEVKDWAISRERYWATPLPIFQCVKCDTKRLVGSYQELQDTAIGSGNTYYILRHGYSTRDEAHEMIISSRLDTDTYHLTPEGEKQIEQVAKELQILEDQIDVIYSSPFARTLETAQVAAKILHQEVKIDNRIKEIVHGEMCEGKSHINCPLRDGRKSFDQKHDGGESYNDVRLRMEEFMGELETKYRNKKILIVSHGDPLWLLEKMGRGMTESQIGERRHTTSEWYPKIAELKKMAWHTLPRNERGELDPHRPFVDEIVLRCPECKAEMKRIPDLIDVWFDSGAMPYAQWHWPFENDALFKEQFPADFITEGVDQTRGWFYTLLAISTLLDKGPAYRNVMSLGHVLDEKGQKMSKSKGNVVVPGTIMDAYGVDTVRWYFYTLNAPGEPKLFSEKEVRERLTGFMSTLQNTIRFYELYAKEASDTGRKSKNLLDTWVLSRMHGLVQGVTESLDAYDPMTAARAIERFLIDDISNWWLRRSRKRPEALPVLKELLLNVARLIAPFAPYTAEDMFQRMLKTEERTRESIHLEDWPKAAKRSVNEKLEAEMDRVREIVTAGLAIRKEKQMKVRQPLAKATIPGKKLHTQLEALVRDELNVKEIAYGGEAVELDMTLSPALRAEGYARELMRQIQDMRKEAKYHFNEKVYCQWYTDDEELSNAILQWGDMIKEDTVLSELVKQKHDERAYDVEKEFDIAPGKKIWLGVKK